MQVGRPNNVPQAAAIITSIHEEASKYNRIYVASIHLDLTEADIMRWAWMGGRYSVGAALCSAQVSKVRMYALVSDACNSC